MNLRRNNTTLPQPINRAEAEGAPAKLANEGLFTRNPLPRSLIRCVAPGSSFTGAALPCKAKVDGVSTAFDAHTPQSAAPYFFSFC